HRQVHQGIMITATPSPPVQMLTSGPALSSRRRPRLWRDLPSRAWTISSELLRPTLGTERWGNIRRRTDSRIRARILLSPLFGTPAERRGFVRREAFRRVMQPCRSSVLPHSSLTAFRGGMWTHTLVTVCLRGQSPAGGMEEYIYLDRVVAIQFPAKPEASMVPYASALVKGLLSTIYTVQDDNVVYKLTIVDVDGHIDTAANLLNEVNYS